MEIYLTALFPTLQGSELILRFIVKGCSDSKLTLIFGIRTLFTPRYPNFTTSGQGVRENSLSFMGQSKKLSFEGKPV